MLTYCQLYPLFYEFRRTHTDSFYRFVYDGLYTPTVPIKAVMSRETDKPEDVSPEEFLDQVKQRTPNKATTSDKIKDGLILVALILLSAVLIILAGWMLIAGLFWFFAGGTHR